MALHFDLQVNTETIGTFYARRLNEGIQEPDSINVYQWLLTDGKGNFRGTIEHRFGDGAWTLVELVLQEVWKQKQERIAYSLEA
jgi:hypothetical protein